MRFPILATISCGMLALGAGCQSERAARQRALHNQPPVNVVVGDDGLMVGEDFVDAAQYWRFARNDNRLGSTYEGVYVWQALDVRQRDYQRTINGRPREFSTTITSSIKRGHVR